MAPKNKFTRTEMIAGAVEVVRKKGMQALTARAVADELGVSTQPIFTCFSNMEELQQEVISAGEKMFHECVMKGLKEKIPFLGFGMQYISFAKSEPEIYRMLMLRKTDNNENSAIKEMKCCQELIRNFLMEHYNIDANKADRYFRDLWLVVHSLSTLIVTGGCPYSEQEIGQILSGFSISIYKSLKEIPDFETGKYNKDKIFSDLRRM